MPTLRSTIHIVVVDIETTGLDPAVDDIIMLALTPVELDAATGRTLKIGSPYVGRRQPRVPMTEEVERIVGIGNEELEGLSFDVAHIDSMLESCDLVVAHNAEFDRAFLEPQLPTLATLPWACSLTDIDWRDAEGQPQASLDHLLSLHGMRSDGSVAADASALAHLLSRPLPVTPTTGYAHLLQAAKRIEYRLRLKTDDATALSALGEMGYVVDDASGQWMADFESEDDLHSEVASLAETCLLGQTIEYEAERRDAVHRFSARRGPCTAFRWDA